MDYIKLYRKICERGQIRIKEQDVYYEKHHIIPKCLGGANDDINITLLTGREHYLVHYLLCKIYPGNYKLACAFNCMCQNDKNQKRNLTSRQYHKARELFSKHHPMHQPEIKEKARKKLKEVYKIKKIHTLQRIEEKLKICKADNCDNKVKTLFAVYCCKQCYYKTRKKTFSFTEKQRKKLSKIAKNRIAKLSDKEQKERLKKSLHSDKINHKKRGEAISKSKKGKTTKQYEIMGKRYAKMTDTEFNNYLLEHINPQSWTRLINCRKKWLNKDIYS